MINDETNGVSGLAEDESNGPIPLSVRRNKVLANDKDDDPAQSCVSDECEYENRATLVRSSNIAER